MKASTVLPLSLLAMDLSAWTGVVRADKADATCEVRKDADKQQGKSGPCTVSLGRRSPPPGGGVASCRTVSLKERFQRPLPVETFAIRIVASLDNRHAIAK